MVIDLFVPVEISGKLNGRVIVWLCLVCCKSTWTVDCMIWINNGSYWEPSQYVRIARMRFLHGDYVSWNLRTQTDLKVESCGFFYDEGAVACTWSEEFEHGLDNSTMEQLGIQRARDESSSSSWVFQTGNTGVFLWDSWLLDTLGVFETFNHWISPKMTGCLKS